jgi:S-adenosyl-L-methionine hydrolase (adenosine-forming)
MPTMIVLFTDFGADDIYVAQVKAALLDQLQADTPIVDLLHSVPNFDVKAGAHLLAALQDRFPARTVFLAVVDPGVGTARDAVIVEADDKCFVGPDNGLLSVTAARAATRRIRRIVWRPLHLSASFHGRDLFAPVVAWIANGAVPSDKVEEIAELSVQLGPNDLAEIIHVDHYGNALTGLLARNVSRETMLGVHGHRLPYVRVFAEAPAGGAFWYANSLGLVEIAANRAEAAQLLGIRVGDPVVVSA